MDNLINTIFPSYCIFCKRTGPMVCYECTYSCKAINTPVCVVCQSPAVEGYTHPQCSTKTTPTQLFSAFEYEGNTREVIRKSKYAPLEYGVMKQLSKYGVKYALNNGYFLSGFTIVSIPLSKAKLRKRGFNQAKLISQEIHKNLGLPMQDSILIRELDTVAQSEFGRKERMKNLKGVFVANPNLTKGKRILLVDDICTTGATLLEASSALYEVGAKEVRCFTLSRVL